MNHPFLRRRSRKHSNFRTCSGVLKVNSKGFAEKVPEGRRCFPLKTRLHRSPQSAASGSRPSLFLAWFVSRHGAMHVFFLFPDPRVSKSRAFAEPRLRMRYYLPIHNRAIVSFSLKSGHRFQRRPSFKHQISKPCLISRPRGGGLF